MKYICLSCNHKFIKRGDNAYHKCPECNSDAWWEGSGYHTGSFAMKHHQTWGRYETAMRTGNLEQQVEASEKFTQERDHALKTDPKSAKYEKDRRESLAKDKPAWRKREMEKLRNKGL